MTEREALKLALEALEVDAYVYNGEKSWKAINAIKEALAQPEQEPSCAECGAGGGHALYCVACAEKFVGGYKEQEPVAFLTNRRQRLNVEFNATGLTLMPKSVDWKIPLYTTPPQRKPFNHHEFGYWWFEYGSGLAPLEGEDQEQHAYRVATEAWKAAHGIK